MRLFGTVNLKPGAGRSEIVGDVPEPLEVVPDTLLAAVAGDALLHPPAPGMGTKAPLDVILTKLAERGITVTRTRPLPSGVARQLSPCPFHPERPSHNTASALYSWDDGNTAFRCLGATCTTEDHRILDLLQLLDLRPVTAPGAKSGGIRLVAAVDVHPRKVELVWDGRIVRHDLNAFLGDEKIGKGLALAWLAAQLTTGRLSGAPEPVAYISAEEQTEMVQRPRLEAAGADLNRVFLTEMGSIGLPAVIPELVEALGERGISWVLLDPINKQFSHDLNPDAKQDVIHVLGKLAMMAAEHRITVVGSLHTNRGGGISARSKWAHSLEFRRALRSAVILGQVEEDDKTERTLVHDFCNYGPTAAGLKGRITTAEIETVEGADSVPLVSFTDTTEATAEDLFLAGADLDGAIARAKENRSERAQCKLNIQGKWAQLGRPLTVPAAEFKTAMKDFSKMTRSRARRDLGIETVEERNPETGLVEGWVWHFPAEMEDLS